MVTFSLVSLFKREVEYGTGIRTYGDVSAILQDGVLDNGKTKTCASQLSASALVYTVKTLEDASEVFWWNAYTIVSKGKMPVSLGFSGGYFYGSGFTCVCNGVVCEVSENAVDKLFVAVDDDIVWQEIVELHLAILESDMGLLNNISNKG